MKRTAPMPGIPEAGQSLAGVQILTALHYLPLIFAIFALFQLWMNSRTLLDRIETMHNLDLPDNVRNLGWYDYTWNGYVFLIKFTVDVDDLETALHSSGWTVRDCLERAREAGFMPDFYTDPALDWWQPFNATSFDGVTCTAYNPKGLAPNYNLMVDYSIPGEATVYFEEYSIDSNHKRALVD